VEASVAIAPAELTAIRFFDPAAPATRGLAGQSPYIANVDLTFSEPKWGTTVSAYYNVFGRRISQVSPPGTPSVMEESWPSLDLILNQRFGERWKVSLSAKNLLNRSAEETYTYLGREYLRAARVRGVTTSLGVTFTY